MKQIDQQISLGDIDAEYQQFVDKFKPKKTTDDCYTPSNIYEAVLRWAVKEYDIDPANVVRPFWPGGDYEREIYPDNCVVLDNPPFSCITKICRTFSSAGISFFLFAPYLTNFQIRSGGVTHIITDTTITYENGAKVNTAFVTNLDPEYKIRTAPELGAAIRAADYENTHKGTKVLQKYKYPPQVVTATMIGYISKYGIDFRIRKEEAAWIKELQSQRTQRKQIFGGGYLISEKAAAEKAAAEKAAAEKAAAEKAAVTEWTLSKEEKMIVERLSHGS